MAAGRKTGGRQKGTPNAKRATETVLQELGCDPLKIVALHAMNQLPCLRCDDDGMVDPIVGYHISGVRSAKALEAAVEKQDDGMLTVCPECAGTKTAILKDGEQLRAAIRLLDSQLPKLSSIIYEDKTGKTMLSRMNAVTRKRQEALARKMQREEQRAQEERDS